MEKFKKFEVEKQETILGGYLWDSVVIYSNGAPAGKDLYDDETDRWIDLQN